MTCAALIYPHQLFAHHPALAGMARAVIVEDPLLFTQFRFHRKKLILHRAAMKRYAKGLQERGVIVHYIDASELAETGSIVDALRKFHIGSVRYVELCDD
jgi:deoxyribodipyrimidine photolyase-related protein